MPALSNARHEKFAQNLAAGLTQTAAYLDINPQASLKTAMEGGSRLARSNKVTARVAELTAPALAYVGVSAEMIVREAWDIAQHSRVDVARVSALTLLAKRHPEFSDKHEIEAKIGVMLVRQTRGLRSNE